MAEGSRVRAGLAGLLLLALTALAAWALVSWRGASPDLTSRDDASVTAVTTPSLGEEPERPPTDDPAPSADPVAEPTPAEPTPELEPVPPPGPTPERLDDDGPATGRYAAFSPSHQLTHPDTDPEIRRWYDWFGYFVGDEVGVPSGAWANKAELWDQLAPALREEAMSLGDEVSAAQFPGMQVIPAFANVRWSTEDTQGRGELVEFAIVFDSEDDTIERYHAVLIGKDEDARGFIHARMEPFDLFTSAFPTFSGLRDAAAEKQWQWVGGQPTIGGGG